MSQKAAARVTRVEVYATWLTDDVDGLVHNIKPILGERNQHSTAILAEARNKVATALAALDTAIEADRIEHLEHA